jgi:hypothetical protein
MLRIAPELHGYTELGGSTTPAEYVRRLRRSAAETLVDGLNQSSGSADAYIDDDDDVAFAGRDHGTQAIKQFRRSLKEHAEVLSDSAEVRYPRLRTVPVDTLPWHYFDAGAGPAPGHGDVILITSWLAFLGLWVEWVECFFFGRFGPVGDNELVRIVPMGKALAGALLGVVPLQILEKCDQELEQRLGSRRDKPRAGFYMNIMRAFVVLHEFGHVALGHTDQLRQWRAKDELSHDEQIARSEEERECESAADSFAIEFVKNASPSSMGTETGRRGRDEQFLYASLMLFMLFDLGDFARSRASDVGPLDSHPPPIVRFTNVANRVDAPQMERLVQFAHSLLKQ